MMDILMSETCWAHKKWNKIASDIKLVYGELIAVDCIGTKECVNELRGRNLNILLY